MYISKYTYNNTQNQPLSSHPFSRIPSLQPLPLDPCNSTLIPYPLSARYISERFLPDKAIDLVDEAAAKLNIELTSKPQAIDDLDRRIIQLQMGDYYCIHICVFILCMIIYVSRYFYLSLLKSMLISWVFFVYNWFWFLVIFWLCIGLASYAMFLTPNLQPSLLRS